jgi:ribonuclease BN (tRNA processing enzyme)
MIINEPLSIPQKDLTFEVEAFELPREKEELPFQVDCMELCHTSLTLGYRLHLDEKIIAYCSDTGYCNNAVELAKNAAVLITECSFRSGESSPEWPHLNPQEASRIAKEAGVQKLVLTHFDASRYPTMAARKAAEKTAKETFPNTMASVDDMEIEI